MILAILLGGLTYFFLGALWYSSLLFGPAWIKLANLTPEKIAGFPKPQRALAFGGSLFTSLVTSTSLAALFTMLHPVTWSETIAWGSLVALGIVATSQLPTILFLGRPIRLYLIDTGYHVVGVFLCFIAMAIRRFYFSY